MTKAVRRPESREITMTDVAPKREENKQRTTTQVIEVLSPIVEKVESIIGKIKGLAWIYLISAVGLWAMIAFFSTTNVMPWLVSLSVLGLVLFALPSVILFLFYGGLKSIVNLPTRLLKKAGTGEENARNMLASARLSNAAPSSERAGTILRSLFDLRSLVLESKGMLLEYATLLRLANPFVLALVGIAVVSGFFIVIATVITAVVFIF